MNPPGKLNIRIVCATRSSDAAFYQETALGKSLAAAYLTLPFIELVLFPSNETGCRCSTTA